VLQLAHVARPGAPPHLREDLVVEGDLGDAEPCGELVRLDDWLRDVAPSDELRKWFGHDPERWEEFKKRYFKELDANAGALSELVAAAKHGEVTLLFGAKDEEHNNAVALRAYLEQEARRAAPAGTRPRRPHG
jgi:uncharacterized protein YeaO (DUF488 family)